MTRPTDWLAFARRVEEECIQAVASLYAAAPGIVLDGDWHAAITRLELLRADARALAIREETKHE